MPIPKKPIRVPVKWEDGQWKAVLGNIEEIKPGALAELYIDRALFVDQARANQWAAKRTVVVLPPGAELRVALTVYTDLDEPVVSRNSNEAIGQCASRLLDDPRRLVSPYTPLQCPHRFSLFSCCS
jgi:hypothetical protein